MKKLYLDIMEAALKCYSTEQIQRYYEDVRTNGLKEHGFPRLTSNMGLLIAFGRIQENIPIFLKMMDLCCERIPVSPEAANDFSVREICLCIERLIEARTFPPKITDRWIERLKDIIPQKVYTVVAKTPDDNIDNWAVFAAVSEFFRDRLCQVDTTDFIDLQFETQFKKFDENGMYRDPNNPMVYDSVTRGLFQLALRYGYSGKWQKKLSELMSRASEKILFTQSVTGGFPFGGRSNQCIFNEMLQAADFEFHAARLKETNPQKAGQFKAGAVKSIELTFQNIDTYHSHVKNCYPPQDKFGCEPYAYFNKYMITVASNAYLAYLVADDSVLPTLPPDMEICALSKDFHKVFATGFGWSLEWDTDADFHYDANGLGRIHRKGAPETLLLSVPFPGKEKSYRIPENESPMCLCAYATVEGKRISGSDHGFSAIRSKKNKDHLLLEFDRELEGISLTESFLLSENQLIIRQNGGPNCGLLLPVLLFDGKENAVIQESEGQLCVSYHGYTAVYSFRGRIYGKKDYYNRNGIYTVYDVRTDSATVTVSEQG